MAMRERDYIQIENELLDAIDNAKDEAIKEYKDKIERLENRIETIEKYLLGAGVSLVNTGGNVKSVGGLGREHSLNNSLNHSLNYSDSSKNLEDIINNVLMDLGIRQHLKGYTYIVEAIKLMYEDEDAISGITKNIYPGVAKRCKSTPLRVERAIRHAIETGVEGNDMAYRSIFGNTLNRKKGITNGHFLVSVFNLVKHSMR